MYFWNQSNFEGLLAIAARLRCESGFQSLADYCELREKGLREQALQSLSDFIRTANSWDVEAQRAAANLVFEIHFAAPRAHQFLAQPLIEDFLKPTLESWRSSDPQNSVPARWLGALSQNVELLREALSLDSTDQFVRDQLIRVLLKSVEYATHHLTESSFLGDEKEAGADLDEVEKSLRASTVSPRYVEFEKAYTELRRLLNDWVEYKSSRDGTFPEWCKKQGKAHRWGSVFYYEK